jgi:hypothetical protein
MGKKLIIKGADFHVNAITDTSYEMVGEILEGSWVRNGESMAGTVPGYKIVIFEVVPGDAYTFTTDKTSSAIGFTATKPTAGATVPYVDGERHLAYPNQPCSGIVPAGAHYVSFGMYAPDAGNLFPESATFGNGYIDCEDYR